jgi:hypothetical protein
MTPEWIVKRVNPGVMLIINFQKVSLEFDLERDIRWD